METTILKRPFVFCEKTKAAGFPDLHLNAVQWGVQILPGEQQVKNPKELLSALGFNSTTSYVWIHHVRLERFPVTPYKDVAAKAAALWQAESPFPSFSPCISLAHAL